MGLLPTADDFSELLVGGFAEQKSERLSERCDIQRVTNEYTSVTDSVWHASGSRCDDWQATPVGLVVDEAKSFHVPFFFTWAEDESPTPAEQIPLVGFGHASEKVDIPQS